MKSWLIRTLFSDRHASSSSWNICQRAINNNNIKRKATKNSAQKPRIDKFPQTEVWNETSPNKMQKVVFILSLFGPGQTEAFLQEGGTGAKNKISIFSS